MSLSSRLLFQKHTVTATEPEKQNSLKFVILSTSIGTLIEWYDLILAIMLAPVLSRNLFPEGDARFLETLAIIVTSYLIRPVGSIIFGSIGDAKGRKKPFIVSLLLMGGATFLIGCIPGFDRIGWFAPAFLLILRLIQGLAISGEYAGATIFVAEHSPATKRGYYTGFIQATVPLGLLLCLSILFVTRSMMTEDTFEAFGWRIPFLFSALLVVLSYFARRKLNETPLYTQLVHNNQRSKSPVTESFSSRSNLALMVKAVFGGCAAQSTLMQTTHFVMLFFLQRTVYLSLEDTLIIIGVATLVACPFFQLCGALSDRVGRKPVMLGGLIVSAIMLPLAFYSILGLGNPQNLAEVHSIALTEMTKIILLIIALHICCAMVYGPLGAFILELFPTRIRFTSMGFTYNIGNGVLGGSTTFLTEFLKTIVVGSALISPFTGLIYPLSLILIAIVVNILFVPETYRKTL